MPGVRARRHDEGPLTEFPPSRRVEVKRIPLLDAQQTTRHMCKLGQDAPHPDQLGLLQTTRNGDRIRVLRIPLTTDALDGPILCPAVPEETLCRHRLDV